MCTLLDLTEHVTHPGYSAISRKYIHNIDKKGYYVACPSGEEVVVPIGINEMYIGVPENRLSLTVIESIFADDKSIPPLVIVPGGTIIES